MARHARGSIVSRVVEVPFHLEVRQLSGLYLDALYC